MQDTLKKLPPSAEYIFPEQRIIQWPKFIADPEN